MNCSLKTSCIAILLMVTLHTAKTQQVFIDSIRSMLIDLDSSIHYSPINNLLQRAIPFCIGNAINDSLTSSLKQLLSDDYILLAGLQQAVSPHLVKKHVSIMQRTSVYLAEKGNREEYKENMMRVAVVMIRAATEKEDFPLYKQAREILLKNKFTQPFSIAKWYYYLAQTYYFGYKPDSCYVMYKRSLLQNPNKTVEENIFYAKTLFALASYCHAYNKRDTASILLQQQLELQKKIHGENSADYAYWLIVTADMYTYMAKYNLARGMNFKAQEITRNTIGEGTAQYALCLNDIGEVYYRTGEYDKSLPYAQHALAIKRKIFGNDYFDNVVSLHNLATLYVRMGLYNEAIPLLQESLAISKKYFGEDVVYSVDLHPLAEVYEYLGEYDKALPLYQKTLEIQRRKQKEAGVNTNNVFYPGILHSMANLYTKLGQFDKAIELYSQALIIKKEVFGKINPEYTRTLNSYAEACLLKGDFKKALSLQLESLSLTKKLFGGTHPNIATGLFNLASLYYGQNNMHKAGEYCNQALQMQLKIFGGKHPDVAASLDMLGNINKQLYRNGAAMDYYQRAFEIRKNTIAPTHPGYIKSLYNIGIMNNKKGFIREAAQLFMEADSAALLHIEQSYISLSEEEKLIYLHNTENQFQYLPSLLYLDKTNNPEIVNRVYSDALILKSMVLFQQQQIYNSIRKSGDSAALQVYNNWRFNKAFVGQQLLLPPVKRRSNFDSLQDVTTQMEEQLSRISASFRINSLHYGTDLKDIGHRLKNDEAAIEFIRFRLYNNDWTDSIIYAAIVLLPGSANAVFVPLCEEKQLNKLLRFSNNSGEAAVNYLYPAANVETGVSNELYHLVWKPLQSLLDSVHTVYYSPCGLLFRISFAAIHAGDGKLLADKYNLRQLLCTRSIALNDDIKNKFTSAELWGDIDYDKTVLHHSAENDSLLFGSVHELNGQVKNYSDKFWKSLPGTKTETRNIFILLKEKNIVCKQESRTAANEEQFKKMDGNSPSLLHIATHGFFLPSIKNNNTYEQNSFSLQQSPMFRSGLLLAGANASWAGRTAHTKAEDGVLTAYEISHLDLSNTQLVTLSACETAVGEIEDNEGVYGLQRAFKMAGAKQVLMSLWSVPDKETTQLMLRFYNSLLQGNDANKALHNAQLAMKEKYSPYYWAGFVLTE